MSRLFCSRKIPEGDLAKPASDAKGHWPTTRQLEMGLESDSDQDEEENEEQYYYVPNEDKRNDGMLTAQTGIRRV